MKIKLLNTGLILTVVLFTYLETVAGEGGGTKAYRPTEVSSPPIIDGKLDEKCWSRAWQVGDFKDLYHRPVSQQTVAAICYDDDFLYIGVKCFEKNINELKRAYTRHDAAGLFKDDCVEIFITPNYYTCSPYFQFLVNCAGVTMEQSSINRIKDRGWNTNWRAVTKIDKDFWTVECAFPINELAPNSSKDLWGISICRERWAGKTELTYWPIGGRFHMPEGHLLFGSYNDYLKKEVVGKFKNKINWIKSVLTDKKTSKFDRVELEKCLKVFKSLNNRFASGKAFTSDEFNQTINEIRDMELKLSKLKRKLTFSKSLQRLRSLNKE